MIHTAASQSWSSSSSSSKSKDSMQINTYIKPSSPYSDESITLRISNIVGGQRRYDVGS